MSVRQGCIFWSLGSFSVSLSRERVEGGGGDKRIDEIELWSFESEVL